MDTPTNKLSALHYELAEKLFFGTLTTDEMFDIWVREQANMLSSLPDGDKKKTLFLSLTKEQQIKLFAEQSNSWLNFQIMINTAQSLFEKTIKEKQ